MALSDSTETPHHKATPTPVRQRSDDGRRQNEGARGICHQLRAQRTVICIRALFCALRPAPRALSFLVSKSLPNSVRHPRSSRAHAPFASSSVQQQTHTCNRMTLVPFVSVFCSCVWSHWLSRFLCRVAHHGAHVANTLASPLQGQRSSPPPLSTDAGHLLIRHGRRAT